MFVQQHNFGEQSVVRCGYTNGVHNSGDHIHQFCEMEMVLDGEIEITINNDRKYTLSRDTRGKDIIGGRFFNKAPSVKVTAKQGAHIKKATAKVYAY